MVLNFLMTYVQIAYYPLTLATLEYVFPITLEDYFPNTLGNSALSDLDLS